LERKYSCSSLTSPKYKNDLSTNGVNHNQSIYSLESCNQQIVITIFFFASFFGIVARSCSIEKVFIFCKSAIIVLHHEYSVFS
jgi:hypothetical protein